MLVFYVLAVEIFDIISTKRREIFLNPVHTVIFTTEPHEQHEACVGIERNGAQKLFNVFVIFAKLRATELMRERKNTVDAPRHKLLRVLCKAHTRVVYATHGGNDINFVADTRPAVRAFKAFERRFVFLRYGGVKLVPVRHVFV